MSSSSSSDQPKSSSTSSFPSSSSSSDSHLLSEEEEVESGNKAEEQVEVVGEKDTKQQQQEEGLSSSSSSSDDDDDEEKEEKLPTKPNTQVSLQTPIPNTQTSRKPVNHLISETPISKKQPSYAKPIDELKTLMANKQPSSSKPIDGKTSKSKKASSSAVVVAAAAAKRRLDAENTNQNDSKKKKKKLVDDVEDVLKSGEKTNLFQRNFSKTDDIVILKGLVALKKEGNSISNVNVLFDNVKSLLECGDVTVNQLINKVQKLHSKHRKNAGNAKQFELYNLLEKIWGDEQQTRTTTGQKKSESKINIICDVVASPTLEKNPAISSPHVEPKGEVKEVPPCSQYKYLDQSLKPHTCLTVPMPPCLGEISAKDGWDMFGSSEARAYDKKWKALIIKETETYAERVELVHEQIKWMMAAYKSSDS